jgi:hypothetical protein
MVAVNSHVLIMSTLAHVLDRLKMIDSRLIDIEDAVMVDDIPDVDEDADIDVDDGTAEAIADQLLDAADEIEESEIVPNHELVAMKLREIAEMLAR